MVPVISAKKKPVMEVNMRHTKSLLISPLSSGKSLALSLSVAVSLISFNVMQLPAPVQAAPAATTKPANDKATTADESKKTDKKDDKKETKSAPEPVIENIVNVQPETLVDHPAEYLNKNIRFTALFSGYNNLAVDYKPAMRSSKNYLSFSVYREHSKVPLSELKLAMVNPKEQDKLTALLLKLKEKDEIEVIGKVFNTALDEPWVDVLKLNLIKAAPDDKKPDGSAPATK